MDCAIRWAASRQLTFNQPVGGACVVPTRRQEPISQDVAANYANAEGDSIPRVGVAPSAGIAPLTLNQTESLCQWIDEVWHNRQVAYEIIEDRPWEEEIYR